MPLKSYLSLPLCFFLLYILFSLSIKMIWLTYFLLWIRSMQVRITSFFVVLVVVVVVVVYKYIVQLPLNYPNPNPRSPTLSIPNRIIFIIIIINFALLFIVFRLIRLVLLFGCCVYLHVKRERERKEIISINSPHYVGIIIAFLHSLD